MERIYNIEDAKKRTLRSVNFYKKRIEAWENVKRIYTKTGANFKILSKNFTGCSFCCKYGDNRIEVCFRDETNSYATDWINLDANYREPAKDTPDKIETAIKDLVKHYKENETKNARGLEIIENELKKLEPELNKLKKTIEAGKEYNINYTMQAYIKEYLHIL
jgi:hypothetical protein